MLWNDKNLVKVLKENGVAVMPTDTIYGIVGKAESKEVVSRIYTIRKRNPEKPFIILIGDISELEKFSITLSKEQKKVLEKYWFIDNGVKESNATSFILDCPDEKFSYLHRGTNSLAFRLPAQKGLRNLLKKTGPLVAPSANLEGFPPAKTIAEAKKYFGDAVDLYIDGGTVEGKASKIIILNKDGSANVSRY